MALESGTKVPSLRFGAGRTGVLMAVLLMLAIRPRGVRNRDVRPLVEQLLGEVPGHMTPGKVSYDLRRLHVHGLIERIEGTHRYRVTDEGLLIAMHHRCRAKRRSTGPTCTPL